MIIFKKTKRKKYIECHTSKCSWVKMSYVKCRMRPIVFSRNDRTLLMCDKITALKWRDLV